MLSAQSLLLHSSIPGHNWLPLLDYEGHTSYSSFVQDLAYLYHKFEPLGIIVINYNLLSVI